MLYFLENYPVTFVGVNLLAVGVAQFILYVILMDLFFDEILTNSMRVIAWVMLAVPVSFVVFSFLYIIG